jgi:hypothetical protein
MKNITEIERRPHFFAKKKHNFSDDGEINDSSEHIDMDIFNRSLRINPS